MAAFHPLQTFGRGVIRVQMGVLLELAVEPWSATTEGVEIAATLIAAGMGLHLRTEQDTGRLVLGACSEKTLNGALAILRHAVGIHIAASAMLVAYRESVAAPADADYTHKMQSHGSGEFARVIIEVAPGASMSGVQFRNEASDRNVPSGYVDGVERGVREGSAQGGSLGWPLTDIDVRLKDGAFHDLDSSPLAFERAALCAVLKAARRAEARLLEPLASVAVLTPERHLSPIASEFERRNSPVAEVRLRSMAAIVASGRMFDLLGFEAELESITGREAAATFVLSGYAETAFHEHPHTTPTAAALRA